MLSGEFQIVFPTVERCSECVRSVLFTGVQDFRHVRVTVGVTSNAHSCKIAPFHNICLRVNTGLESSAMSNLNVKAWSLSGSHSEYFEKSESCIYALQGW